jgi:hypothetical protein
MRKSAPGGVRLAAQARQNAEQPEGDALHLDSAESRHHGVRQPVRGSDDMNSTAAAR